MSLSQLDVLMAFLESVKNISNNFIEVSINELIEESLIHKGRGGYLLEAGMNLYPDIDHEESRLDTILLSGEDDETIAFLYVIYIDDGEEYEDELDRPFFIGRVYTNTCLLDQYDFDNTEEYYYDNRAAKAMNRSK